MATGTIHSGKVRTAPKPLSSRNFSSAGIIGSVAAAVAAATMATMKPTRLARKYGAMRARRCSREGLGMGRVAAAVRESTARSQPGTLSRRLVQRRGPGRAYNACALLLPLSRTDAPVTDPSHPPPLVRQPCHLGGCEFAAGLGPVPG